MLTITGEKKLIVLIQDQTEGYD